MVKHVLIHYGGSVRLPGPQAGKSYDLDSVTAAQGTESYISSP